MCIVNKAVRQRPRPVSPVSARLRRVWLGGDFDRVDAEYDADDANCQVVTSSDWSATYRYFHFSRLFNTLRRGRLRLESNKDRKTGEKPDLA